jgi:hypothetical protein
MKLLSLIHKILINTGFALLIVGLIIKKLTPKKKKKSSAS